MEILTFRCLSYLPLNNMIFQTLIRATKETEREHIVILLNMKAEIKYQVHFHQLNFHIPAKWSHVFEDSTNLCGSAVVKVQKTVGMNGFFAYVRRLNSVIITGFHPLLWVDDSLYGLAGSQFFFITDLQCLLAKPRVSTHSSVEKCFLPNMFLLFCYVYMFVISFFILKKKMSQYKRMYLW